MSFFDKYCNAPSQSVPVPITQQNVIDDYKKHIELLCADTKKTDCIIKYSMPHQFIGRIEPYMFWSYIFSFLKNDMKFTCIEPSFCGSGLLFNSIYESMEFLKFYAVAQKQSSQHGEYFLQDYNCTKYCDVSFVVIRIFKS